MVNNCCEEEVRPGLLGVLCQAVGSFFGHPYCSLFSRCFSVGYQGFDP